jgi:hypothetical protein
MLGSPKLSGGGKPGDDDCECGDMELRSARTVEDANSFGDAAS